MTGKRGNFPQLPTIFQLFPTACIGLLIALLQPPQGPLQNERSSEKPRDLGAPIISGSTNEDYDAEIEENAKAENDWDDEETIGKFAINFLN